MEINQLPINISVCSLVTKALAFDDLSLTKLVQHLAEITVASKGL